MLWFIIMDDIHIIYAGLQFFGIICTNTSLEMVRDLYGMIRVKHEQHSVMWQGQYYLIWPRFGLKRIWIVTNNISTQIWAESKVSRYRRLSQVPILLSWINFNPSMDKWSHTKYNVECNHLFHSQTSKFAPSQVWEWIINFIPHFTVDVITYPHSCESWSMLVKRPYGVYLPHT